MSMILTLIVINFLTLAGHVLAERACTYLRLSTYEYDTDFDNDKLLDTGYTASSKDRVLD